MKQYVIDEIRPGDRPAIQADLDARWGPADLGGIYWIPLEPGLLNPVQARHVDCQPHCVALELETDRLVCEMLVRTRNRMRCDCIGYADAAQRAWLMERVDAIFDRLQIKT